MIPHTPLPLSQDPDQKLAWIKQNRHICRWPWSQEQIKFDFNSQVISTPCCNARINKDDFGRSNDQRFFEIKQAMLEGQVHKQCVVCTNNELKGMTSERIQGLLDMPTNDLEYLLQNLEEEKSYFVITLGNICNLACRSCGPTASTTFAKTYNLRVAELDLVDDQQAWNQTKQKIAESAEEKNVVINLVGGEPMVLPSFHQFLDFIVEQNLNHKVSLSFTTNLTSLPRRVVEALSQIKSTMIMASIDSVYQNYHYVRWPAHFDKVLANLEQLWFLKDQLNLSLILQPVFSMNNIFYFGDYLDFWYDWFDKKSITDVPITNINLTNPDWMNPVNICDPYREQLYNYLLPYTDHPLLQSGHNNYLRCWLSELIQQLKNPKKDSSQFKIYLEKSAFFDKSSQVDFEIYNSRLFDLLIDTDREYFVKYKNSL